MKRSIHHTHCLAIIIVLLSVMVAARSQTLSPLPAAPISNAAPAELTAIQNAFASLERAVVAREKNTLRFFGVEGATAEYSALTLASQLTHVAVSSRGALARQNYRVSGIGKNGSVTLAEGTHEVWLSRKENDTFTFINKRWSPPYDAVAALSGAAREEWERPARAGSSPASSSLLHLVASRRGGRWVALRRSRWDGAILDPRSLQNAARRQTVSTNAALDPDWLRAQMARIPAGVGTAHFLLQKSSNGWIGIGAAWDADKSFSEEADAAALQARRLILTTAYTSANAHRAFAVALGQVGLFNEAADELEKVEALQPGSSSASLLKELRTSRSRDPETLAAEQLQNEARVGLDPNHPSYLVSALVQDYKDKPSILRALRLGLEHSRLGDDTRATALLKEAQELADGGALRDVSPADAQWIGVLSEHLQERKRLVAAKPPSIIRSPLFTIRCWPNDLSAVQILAALEAAQHTVYAEFNLPMGSTEVLVWRNQAEFRNYTTRFSEQGHSEFVAALTLTKLIGTQQGPVVLGEEINVFTDPRMGAFSTVAHEYGHVAVRQLSKGRDVPTWFNEGIAASVEGGYEGYLERVRSAADARALLSMDEMLEWNVDGERAFLAYSQANSLIDYIVAKWGKDAVLNILRQIGNDTDSDAAFKNILGISQYELWRRWAKEQLR